MAFFYEVDKKKGKALSFINTFIKTFQIEVCRR